MTLTDRIYSVVRQDDAVDALMARADQQPERDAGEYHSMFENDMRDWGMFYGIAFGIARCEDPWETYASVADRAFAAAWEAYTEYTGGEPFHRPERNESVQRVMKLCAQFYEAVPRELLDEIEAMADAFGIQPPAPQEAT